MKTLLALSLISVAHVIAAAPGYNRSQRPYYGQQQYPPGDYAPPPGYADDYEEREQGGVRQDMVMNALNQAIRRDQQQQHQQPQQQREPPYQRQRHPQYQQQQDQYFEPPPDEYFQAPGEF